MKSNTFNNNINNDGIDEEVKKKKTKKKMMMIKIKIIIIIIHIRVALGSNVSNHLLEGVYSYPLRKHAYSNIFKISSPKTEKFQIKNSD